MSENKVEFEEENQTYIWEKVYEALVFIRNADLILLVY